LIVPLIGLILGGAYYAMLHLHKSSTRKWRISFCPSRISFDTSAIVL
jgi:hypothetical protein